jgi:hypothetical protein
LRPPLALKHKGDREQTLKAYARGEDACGRVLVE